MMRRMIDDQKGMDFYFLQHQKLRNAKRDGAPSTRPEVRPMPDGLFVIEKTDKRGNVERLYLYLLSSWLDDSAFANRISRHIEKCLHYERVSQYVFC